jgi:hypothetical protein
MLELEQKHEQEISALHATIDQLQCDYTVLTEKLQASTEEYHQLGSSLRHTSQQLYSTMTDN